VGGRHTGTVSGIMNTASAIAGGAAAVLTGLLRDLTGGFTVTFHVSSVLYLLGLCCWLFIDPVTPLVPEETKPEGGLT
jgi:predicted MFS family arabinose efflux permease